MLSDCRNKLRTLILPSVQRKLAGAEQSIDLTQRSDNLYILLTFNMRDKAAFNRLTIHHQRDFIATALSLDRDVVGRPSKITRYVGRIPALGGKTKSKPARGKRK